MVVVRFAILNLELVTFEKNFYNKEGNTRGISSAGRAPRWQHEGHRFDTRYAPFKRLGALV
ncbi:hypothetical protein [Halalkalibacter kiskunsagensis]|uniref:hypothetical protein n=1 Tax=Halalkalibacter kiskunsagensis TaxID=1548599 RepID=UPI00300A01DE